MPTPRSQKLTKKQTEWQGRLQEWEASGLPLAAYARTQGLRPQQFYSWRTYFRGLGLRTPSAKVGAHAVAKKSRLTTRPVRPSQLGFVAARVVPEALAPRGAGVQIRFPNGIVIEVRSSHVALPDVEILTQLARLP